MKRIIVIVVLLALLAGGGYLGWKWFFEKQDTIDAYKLVPQDAVFVVETDEPVEAWKQFAKSPLWQHEKKFKPLGDIGKMADALTRTVDDNDLIFSAFGHRTVLISAHVTSPTDYDFLYVCDMKQGAKFSSISDGIIGLLKKAGYSYSSETQGEATIHKFFDPKDKSTLHLSFVANQLICSYTYKIIRASLDAQKTNVLNKDDRFKAITEKTAAGGLCKIYLNHAMVPSYLDVYMDDVSGLKGLFSSMFYTGAKAELGEDMVKLSGYTNINDSMGSHLRALMRSGSSRIGAHEVLSDRTAFMLSMGFEGFGKFYENLKDVMKQDDASWKDFEKNKRLVEKVLRIDLEDDVMGWIDNEVTLAQYQQDRVIGSQIHSVVAIKALSEDRAKEKLGKLEKRLKLIGKFKSETYKNHEIHYMEIRGMFRFFFGKMFDKIQKPYYTYLNDYVIFCDDPTTLLQTVDDFEAGKTLAKEEAYKSFYGEFNKESSVFTYLNMKKYFLNLKGILDAPSYQSSYNNRQYIISFPRMGFQLTKDEDLFDTRLRISFAVPSDYDLEITEGKALSQEDLENLDSMSDADAFLLEYINGSVKKEMYDNGKVKILAEMEGGELDGRYLEYWENGELKVKGKYRKGKKSGKWYYYNESGELDHKEKHSRKGDEPDTDSPPPPETTAE